MIHGGAEKAVSACEESNNQDSRVGRLSDVGYIPLPDALTS